jgi:hyperosmotically inducible protein
MTDKRLRQDILDELDYDPKIDATNIGVIVEGGVVTLTGYLPSYVQKSATIDAVRRLKGVRAVADQIQVRFPDDKQLADDQIAQRALDILEWDVQVPSDAIQVTVHNGWITLSGEVSWQYERSAAEDDVRRLSGVKGVINNIVIKRRPQLPDLQRRIENALKRHAEIEAKAIQVAVDDGKVTLSGKVRDLEERTAVENAAWSAPGVRLVEDRLTIG